MQSVRPDAPWCPSNIEFIRRINGLDTIEDVQRIVFDASYLVLGLGDVYLGAPVATPVDPRHRLVTTKYNPARTWTPENAVGHRRRLPVHLRHGGPGRLSVRRAAPARCGTRSARPPTSRAASPGCCASSIRSASSRSTEEELLAFRAAFPRGRVGLKIEETTFRFADYRAFLDANAASIEAFRTQQRAAFVAERERWASLPPPPEMVEPPAATEDAVPPGAIAVRAAVTGSVWQIAVPAGTRVAAGDRLVVLETMKMETPVLAPAAGVVVAVCCAPGALVRPGQTLVGLRLDG